MSWGLHQCAKYVQDVFFGRFSLAVCLPSPQKPRCWGVWHELIGIHLMPCSFVGQVDQSAVAVGILVHIHLQAVLEHFNELDVEVHGDLLTALRLHLILVLAHQLLAERAALLVKHKLI